ncbi:MMPL family transporter [Alteribacillus sp. YIM 98480]|uniref:MMPL family transporter n=1 Tax=Alteribacillus sp. YIM 98480 TaxID=2606599 RepID=UPI00131DFFDF|nr:MMPL family transporter [Alteribacillus sp. YIM 98480]
MRAIIKFRWLIAVLLAVLTAGLFFYAPSLTELAEEEDSFQLPANVTSQQADDILNEAGEGEETISLVLQLDEPLTDNTEKEIQRYIEEIENGKNTESITNPFEREELREQLISENEDVVLVPVAINGSADAVEAGNKIESLTVPDGMKRYVTGDSIISDDVDKTTQEGLEKTEGITVILIFILLLVVFRAVVTPFVPLISVAITYLLSQSIVSLFVEWFGFPVSTYTQIFLVAVLFGIGTDYCILLLSRYKEELSAGHAVQEAIINTYKTAGKTLFYSGLAVFVGFSAIGFANFAIFQSAVGVAVGIFVLLIVLYTLVPFFMAVLKEKLFWPSKQAASHHDSKLWKAMGSLSVYRPIFSIAIVALLTVPFLVTYDNDVSYNNTDEISAGAESVEGLRVIEEAFGMGDALPLQVVIDTEEDMVTAEKIAYVENLSQAIERSDDVEEVRSVTRPTGYVIDELYVDTQMEDVSSGIGDAREGLSEVQDGLTEIENGLHDMNNQVSSSGSGGSLDEAIAGVEDVNEQVGGISQQLQQTRDIQTAVKQLAGVQQGLTEIQSGLEQGNVEISAQQQQSSNLSGGLEDLAAGVQEAIDGLEDIETGLEEAESFTEDISEAAYTRGTGVFVPEEFLEEEDFQDAVDEYVFSDNTGMTLEVSLKDDPNSLEAINASKRVKRLVDQEIQGTPLAKGDIAYSGVPGIHADLQEVSSEDFTKTILIILVGLFVILAVLLRSLFQPLFILAGLLLTYYTAMGAAELIFVNGLGYPGIMWPVPFFAFVMLVALGVDYSIFLFDRYREEAALGVRQGLMKSMVKMGTVIITAAIILSGTFGAMIPSGVLTLMQVGTVVVTGLMLFGLVILPLFIPAVVSFNESNQSNNPS